MAIFKRCLVRAVLVVACTAELMAQSPQVMRGWHAYNDEDYQEAYSIWSKLAAKGDQEALYGLSLLYLDGLGTEKNTAKGLDSLRQSAEAGNDDAAYNLGVIYLLGRRVPPDKAQARAWLIRAGKNGHTRAIYALGRMALDERDYGSAASCFQRACDDFPDARYDLALLQDQGLGVPKDPAKALENYKVAAEKGSSDAQYRLGVLFETGQGAFKQDPVKAFEWYERAADQGHVEAQASLGRFLLNGTGGARDLDTAFEWLELAADNGSGKACVLLGDLYLEGKECPRDASAAREMYLQAARANRPEGYLRLGMMLQAGEGGPRDPEESVFCFAQAAEAGLAEAQYRLGLCHTKGLGVPVNDQTARCWFDRAARQGHEEAKTELWVLSVFWWIKIAMYGFLVLAAAAGVIIWVVWRGRRPARMDAPIATLSLAECAPPAAVLPGSAPALAGASNTLHPAGETAGTPAGHRTDAFNQLYQAGEFVSLFGVISLVGSILINLFFCIGPGILVGLGLVILKYASESYYKRLGYSMFALAAAATALFLFPIWQLIVLMAGILLLSFSIFLKAHRLHRQLAAAGRDDPDWRKTYDRATLAMATGGLAMFILPSHLIWLIYALLASSN